MKIKATFKGKDGSCGFFAGKEYDLEITQLYRLISVLGGDNRYCDYETVISFLNNWDNIKTR